jgi:hypothetical protein
LSQVTLPHQIKFFSFFIVAIVPITTLSLSLSLFQILLPMILMFGGRSWCQVAELGRWAAKLHHWVVHFAIEWPLATLQMAEWLILSVGFGVCGCA